MKLACICIVCAYVTLSGLTALKHGIAHAQVHNAALSE